MLKTQKLAAVAEAVVTMTYKELVALAEEIKAEPGELADWAEKYRTPAPDPQ